jgi:DNA ligase D-like protein (predicted polymerase)
MIFEEFGEKTYTERLRKTDAPSCYIYLSTESSMLVRKNTKAFKTILEIVSACRDRPDREQLIRVYITKAGDTVKDRINVEGIEGGAGLFYEMGYQAVMGNLKSSNHQLNVSDEFPGVYFFHSSSNKVWDETPFEFDEAIKKEFGSLPELPVLRRKEKAEKFAFPASKVKTVAGPDKKKKTKSRSDKEKSETKKEKAESKAEKAQPDKDKAEPKKPAKVVDLWPRQPDYKLKHEVHFSGLERITFRQSQLTKKDVLDYYNKISGYLLPYLKDRPQSIRLQQDGQPRGANLNLESLAKNSREEIPEWIEAARVGKPKAQEQLLLCNDKEHLLFYVQIGCVEFNAGHSRIKSLDSPDYIILAIESPEYELAKPIEVAIAVREIFTGLQLPSFVKTDATSGLHVYIPLDSKSEFEISKQAAEFLCKLVRLKIPNLVALKGAQGAAYGKVSLDYSLNERGKGVIAPYSLVAGQSANVATPLLWEEVKAGLTVDAFNHETIFERLKAKGDVFETIFRKKVNAEALMERLEEGYSFLITD